MTFIQYIGDVARAYPLTGSAIFLAAVVAAVIFTFLPRPRPSLRGGAFPAKTNAMHREPVADDGKPPPGFRVLEGAPILKFEPRRKKMRESDDGLDDSDFAGAPRIDPDDNAA